MRTSSAPSLRPRALSRRPLHSQHLSPACSCQRRRDSRDAACCRRGRDCQWRMRTDTDRQRTAHLRAMLACQPPHSHRSATRRERTFVRSAEHPFVLECTRSRDISGPFPTTVALIYRTASESSPTTHISARHVSSRHVSHYTDDVSSPTVHLHTRPPPRLPARVHCRFQAPHSPLACALARLPSVAYAKIGSQPN